MESFLVFADHYIDTLHFCPTELANLHIT